MADIEIIGLKDLEKAIARNPQTVKQSTKIYFQRGLAAYRRGIYNSPWSIGDTGGGAPVDTRNLVQSHGEKFGDFEASIGPARRFPVEYAIYVHQGTKRMKKRPWLDFVRQQQDGQIQGLQRDLLENIVKQLAK